MGKQAVDAPRITGFAMDPDDLIIIGYDTDDGPQHPLYDERVKLPLDEGFVQDIMLNGVIQTVTARKNGDKIEVTAGRRRVRHAREANKRLKAENQELIKVPILIRRGSDAEHAGVGSSENQHRVDDPPIIVARKAQRLLNLGKTEQEVAVHIGVTKTHLKNNILKLLECDPSVQKAVDDGKLAPSKAVPLAALDRAAQREELEKLLASGGSATTDEVKRNVRARKNNGSAENDHPPPSKRTLKKILKANAALEDGLPPEFIRGIKFVLGELSPKSVKGLSELMGAK